MRNIFILYDSSCELCRRCRTWIQFQRQIVHVTFLAAGSAEARKLFPNLDHERTLSELTVVTDSGAVYQGTKAYVMCLWVLRDFRKWSKTLASPEMLPLAKRFITMLSETAKSFNGLIAS